MKNIYYKNILVAGGAGFLGSHLCEKLTENPHHFVFCVDNLLTSRQKNIEHLQEKKNFKFIHEDITHPLNLTVNEIYNLACPASPVHYQHDPITTLKINFEGTLNLLELAKKNRALFFQASTSEVYGDPEIHPQTETYWGNVNPIGIRACYDEGKRCAETLCFEFYRQYQVRIRIARIFNTYGPRMQENDGRVISNFICQALKNSPITIYGNGEQTRSFCYVDDLIEGIQRLMYYPEHIASPVNLGNPKELSIIKIAQEIIRLAEKKSNICFKPLPEDDPRKRKPNITLAQKLLNWHPKIPLEEGLIKTIYYFKQYLNNRMPYIIAKAS